MPIVMSKDEWSRIAGWKDRGREDAETTRRKEYIRYLHETSRAMTKLWPNSVENVNKRNEELRRARIEASEQANTNFYKKYVKQKKQEQQRLLHDARDVIFKNKDAPKMFLSAVLETVTQKEREEQIKFLQELRRQAAEQKKRDEDDIIRRAKEWHELMEIKKKRRFEANKKYQQEILDQAREVSERNMNEYETELNLQKKDNLNAEKEMAAIKKFDQEFKEAEKTRILTDIQRSRQEAEARRHERQTGERLDERLLEVLRRTQARVDNKRKQTEKETQNEKLRVLELISQKLETGDAAKEAKDQEMLEKAVKEREDKAAAQRQALAKKQEQLKQERLETHRKHLEDEEQRLHELHTIRQWELMNRFKNKEIYEDFLDKQRMDKNKKTKEYREELLKLRKERDEREAAEKAESRYFYGEYAEQRLREAEQRALAHGAALLREARRHRRPTHALHRALDRYCKQQRMYAMPQLPRALQSHFAHYAPEDRTRVGTHDDGLASPPDDVGDDVHDALKRDGLDAKSGHDEAAQEVISDQDYKRKAPANGLQMKDSQNDVVTLPDISAVQRKSKGGK